MENLLTNLLSYSIVPTLITLIITKITEGRIQSSFERKLESTKKEHSLDIAKFQSELDSLKAKENFKFTKLHVERFKVLKETYALLIRPEIIWVFSLPKSKLSQTIIHLR